MQGLHERCSGGLLMSVALAVASTRHCSDEVFIRPRVLVSVLVCVAWYAPHSTTVLRSIKC